MDPLIELIDATIADLQRGANDILLIAFIAAACAVGVLIGY